MSFLKKIKLIQIIAILMLMSNAPAEEINNLKKWFEMARDPTPRKIASKLIELGIKYECKSERAIGIDRWILSDGREFVARYKPDSVDPVGNQPVLRSDTDRLLNGLEFSAELDLFYDEVIYLEKNSSVNFMFKKNE